MKYHQPLHFEGLGLRHYRRGPFRAPRKGEYFIQAGMPVRRGAYQGGKVQAHVAKGPMKHPRRIVTPIGDILGEKP